MPNQGSSLQNLSCPSKDQRLLLRRCLGITPQNLLTISSSVWRVTAPLDKPSWPHVKHLKETRGGQETSDSCGCTVGPHFQGGKLGWINHFIGQTFYTLAKLQWLSTDRAITTRAMNMAEAPAKREVCIPRTCVSNATQKLRKKKYKSLN